MKIVVIDKPHENKGEIDWSELSQYGDVTMYDDSMENQLIERIGDADILFVNRNHITKEIIDACPNLKYISVIATGFNKIDIEYAKQKGILVSNVPSYGSKAIGQHAVALLLELTNHVAYNDTEVRKFRTNTDVDWAFWDYPIVELEYKTLGVIGLGRIGATVAKFGLSMGMKVIAYDSYKNQEMQNLGIQYVELEELYKLADVISLHCPLTPENEDMINKESISKMKDGVIILNNSRGGLIDEDALADALNCGKVAGAGLDVVKVEPIKNNNPLLNAKNCFITQHISWSALDCRRRLIHMAIENLRAFLEGNPTNIVNK